MCAQREHVLDYSWLHDDLEEDLVGADWHQDAIRGLSISLKIFALEHSPTWHIGDQLTLVGEKPDATVWRPAPDVSVHVHAGPRARQDLDVRQEGPPALAIEVASASTWRYDVAWERTRRGRLQAGKALGYTDLLHIPEYLIFDPYGEFLENQVRAWRRVGNAAREWQPGADGRYHSQELGISFGVEGPLLRVFDPEGRPIPFWFELTHINENLQRDNTALQHDNAALQQRIADMEAELEKLRGEGAS